MSDEQCCQKFDILATSLSVLRNYFDGSIKLFLDLYLAKFLDFLVKSFCMYIIQKQQIFLSLALDHPFSSSAIRYVSA